MRRGKLSFNDVLYGINAQDAAPASGTPSAAPMLVSLFLILITFFVIMNKNASPDPGKSRAAMQSLTTKFGKPGDELQAFGGIVPPKTQDFTLKLKQLFSNSAMVETTISGEQTKITVPKDFFFYADETEIRDDKLLLAAKTADILRGIAAAKPIRLSIISGQANNGGDYERDHKKLLSLRKNLGVLNAEIGLDTSGSNKITLVISNE